MLSIRGIKLTSNKTNRTIESARNYYASRELCGSLKSTWRDGWMDGQTILSMDGRLVIFVIRCSSNCVEAGVGGKSVRQADVSGIFLGNSVLPDRIYCPPLG